MQINRLYPPAVLPNGLLTLMGDEIPVEDYLDIRVRIGGQPARIRSMRSDMIVVQVPTRPESGTVEVMHGESLLTTAEVVIGHAVLSEIHAVDNPVVDRLNYVYTTHSGSRDEVPEVSVYRVSPQGDSEPYVTAIRNATGLALDALDTLFVSSRFESRIYKVLGKDHLEVFAEDIGTPFGLAFNAQGVLFVGDRDGRILKIQENGEKATFIELPASPIAYHLAFDPDGNLFVAVPQIGDDTIYMIDPFGHVIPYYSGFGRPHGLAFDREGNLYICQGRVGDGGVYRVSASGDVEKILAGPPVVGIAFDVNGTAWINTPNELYRVQLDIYPAGTS